MKHAQGWSGKINKRILVMLASNKFFWAVVALTIIQAAWFAFSIKAGLYDEGRHINAVKYFMEDWNPFGMQGEKWDFLGDLTRDGSYLFYYLLGIVGRIVNVFSNSEYVFITCLRLTILAVFVVGMFTYRKLLIELGLGRAIVNTSLLLIILFPMIAPLPGVVNYDGVVFTAAAATLLYAVRIMKSKEQLVLNVILFLSLGMLGCLMKTQFVALFVPALIFVTVYLLRHYGRSKHKLSLDLARFLKRKIVAICLLSILLITTVLFVERPVYNFVVYQKIAPQSSCEEILGSKERCLRNFVAKRNAELKDSKAGTFKPLSPYDYLFNRWIPVMTSTLLIVIGTEGVNTLFLVQVLFSILIFGGAVLILINLRRLLENRLFSMLLGVSAFYVIILFLTHYKIYVDLGAPVATNGRYLLPVLPIFIALACVSFVQLFERHLRNKVQPVMFMLLLVMMVQGGGIGTTFVQLGDGAYAKENPFYHLSKNVADAGRKIIFEKNPFRRL